MATYLFQGAYTPDALAKLIQNPQNRIKAVTRAVEALGGRVVGGWFCFGEYDVVLISELPDNVSAAAFSVAASAGGALRTNRTTPLFGAGETLDIFKRASQAGYQPPA
jgi:uncharacterized protein with GYD domain